jgi:tRNA threonylcarbamoyladenosine biosynthesis protein TsaB
MLLAVDTATVTASVAVYDLANGVLLAESTWQARRRHTQELLTTTQALLAHVGVQPAELTALAVTTGPGSFTGVRIGLSAIKGIGLGLPSPPRVVGIPTLTVSASPWLAIAQATSAVVWAYIQAGRGRYNWAIFANGFYHPTAADHNAGSAADFAGALATHAEHSLWLVGEPAPDLVDAVAALKHVTLVDGIHAMRRAGVLAHLAAEQLALGHADDVATLQPLYLQEP